MLKFKCETKLQSCIMSPSRHICQILCRRRSPGLDGITTRSPPPSVHKIFLEPPFDELHYVDADIGQEFKRVAGYNSQYTRLNQQGPLSIGYDGLLTRYLLSRE